MANSLPFLDLLSVQSGYGWHMHDGNGYMMGPGWGGWGIAHGIFWLVLLIAIAAIAFVLVRHFASGAGKPDETRRPSALEQLDERYARGEIEREDYLQRKEDLSKD